MGVFVLTHLWQSTLVLLAAWVLTRACKRNSAAVRYWIWFVASAKFLVPLTLLQQVGDWLGRGLPEPLPVDVALFESASAVFVPSLPSAIAASDLMLSQLTTIAAAVWLLGTTVVCARWLLQWWSIRSRVIQAHAASVQYSGRR